MKINKHFNACTKYKKKFLEDHDYLRCELCGISSAIRYETHHIVYASEAPKHKELHNDKNLILLCSKCHDYFHSKKSRRNDLVIKRNLNELFQRNLIINK